MITNPVKRGDIVYYIFGSRERNGSVQAGYRPAVVVQNDVLNESSPTTILAPITHRLKKIEMISHIYIGERFGLSKTSMLLLEQVRTVNQASIIKQVGHIDDEDLLEKIDNGLRHVMALREQKAALSKKRHKRKKRKKPVINQRDIMCLCPVCRNSYRHRGFRVISVGGNSDVCDLCNHRRGFDYAVVGLMSRG